jgi:hypothetical protein
VSRSKLAGAQRGSRPRQKGVLRTQPGDWPRPALSGFGLQPAAPALSHGASCRPNRARFAAWVNAPCRALPRGLVGELERRSNELPMRTKRSLRWRWPTRRASSPAMTRLPRSSARRKAVRGWPCEGMVFALASGRNEATRDAQGRPRCAAMRGRPQGIGLMRVLSHLEACDVVLRHSGVVRWCAFRCSVSGIHRACRSRPRFIEG